MSGSRTLLTMLMTIAILFMIVSFDSTRTVGAWFHGGSALPILFALATECGIVLCNIGRILRARNGQDARWFLWTMVVLIVMSATANALAGGARFTLGEARSVLGGIGIDVRVRWLLIVAYGVIVPLCTFALSELAMALLVDAQPAQPPEPPTLKARVIELYDEHPQLPPAEAARILNCHPATVRRYVPKGRMTTLGDADA